MECLSTRKVAKRELTWEVDYNREAEFTANFREMIDGWPQYKVPKLYKDLTTSRIITTELVSGVPMDQCFNFSEEHRSHIVKMVVFNNIKILFDNCVKFFGVSGKEFKAMMMMKECYLKLKQSMKDELKLL